MNKKFTRKEFVLFVGSLVGLFVISRIPGSDSFKSPLTKKLSTTNHSYGSGSYGGTRVS